MKPKTMLLLATAVGCGLIAMVVVQRALKGGGEQEIEKAEVVVALQSVPSGVELTDTYLGLKEMPLELVPEGAITSVEQYENRALVIPASPGDVITESKLGAEGAFSQSLSIPKGMRVVSVPVDVTQSHSGMLSPGDRVDVHVVFQARTPDGIQINKNATLLEYVEVFAADNQTISDGTGDRDAKMKTVSLLVQPEHASYVNLAKKQGQIELVWRNREDGEIVQSTAIDDTLLAELRGTLGNGRANRYGDKKLEVDASDGESESDRESQAQMGADGASAEDLRNFLDNAKQQTASIGPQQPGVDSGAADAPTLPTWTMEIYAGRERQVHEIVLPEEEFGDLEDSDGPLDAGALETSLKALFGG